MRRLRILSVTVLVLLILGGAGLWYAHASARGTAGYRTEAMTNGDMLASFTATGTVEPEDIVDVGAQVAGKIVEFGPDLDPNTGQPVLDPRTAKPRPIDFGSQVKKGAVLARIDPSIYKALVAQSEADVKYAQADLESAKAAFATAQRDVNRGNQLIHNGTMAQEEYDGFVGTYETTKAQVGVKEGALAKAQAALAQNQLNLGYCTITADIDGTVIDRRVTIGQTVQSSFNTPSLFLLAKDLKRMKVWASVNEADIGNVKLGQTVTFTVDSRPGKTFTGAVSLVRLNATMTNNVVTYTVEVSVDNSDGQLLPYMTAQLRFEVEKHANAVLVPNAALRWNPTSAQQVAPEAREAFARSKRKADGGDQPSAVEREPANRGTVWVEDGGFVKPVAVTLGLTDGAHTEVLGGDLKPGMAVITGESNRQGGGVTVNPFAPQVFGGKKS